MPIHSTTRPPTTRPPARRARLWLRLLPAVLGISLSAPVPAASELAELILADRRDAALERIEAGADVNGAQEDGTTPLHWAVYRLDAKLTASLLAAGADPAAVNRFGAAPLTEAVKAADAGIVRQLLEAGADPDSPNSDGQTALMLAARTGSVATARLLVEHGTDVNARESWRGQTALMWAAAGPFPELTRYLVDQGADVTVRADANDWGSQITSEPRAQYRPTGGLTPLLYAARSGCLECIDAIVAAGEPVDRPTPDGVTPLMLAIDNLQFDAAGRLLDLGANPHYADWWGRTALYVAVDMKSYMPGRANTGTGDGGTTALDLIERLLAADVELDPQLNMHRVGRGGNTQRFTDPLLTTGATPLLRAAILHDHETLRLLLERGALVDLPNVMGVTPLMAATGLGVRDYDFGSNRSPDFAGDAMLEDKVIDSLDILLAAGADIDARVTDIESRTARIARPSPVTDRQGQTALFSAAERGWLRVVEHLLANGADPDIADDLGRTAVDAARGRFSDGAPAYPEVAARLAADANARADSD